MSNEKGFPPAVIIGMEENGLGVARPLARLNIPCVGFATPWRNPACRTNACRVIHATSWEKEAVIDDLSRMGQTLGQKAPILITKDEPVLWISEAREELSRYFHINLPDQETVNLLMDKQQFTRLALEEGWPLPLTWFICSRAELISHLSEIVYPCILKPAVKNSVFRQKSPRKAFKIFSTEELLRVYDMVAQWEEEVVIQEWIEGGDERVAYCLTYYDRQSKPLALFAGRKLRQWPIECGNTAIAAPAPRPWAEKIIDLTDTIFRKVGYRGLGSIEYKMRANSDEPVIMEPTVGRTNYQNEIAVLNGQNIPAIAYWDTLDNKYFPTYSTLVRCKLIDGSAERKAAWQYYRSGRLTLAQWLKDRQGHKAYMRLRRDDPGPFVAAMYLKLRRFAGKAVRHVLGLA
ncbi:MAG: hypothetical protein JSW34_01980 [Candidatus Zixiibacteriota bacterium]|nr:MAG: hypothetical protein JSW34_01980 [candidate division Zixibacteria bacterium]